MVGKKKVTRVVHRKRCTKLSSNKKGREREGKRDTQGSLKHENAGGLSPAVVGASLVLFEYARVDYFVVSVPVTPFSILFRGGGGDGPLMDGVV